MKKGTITVAVILCAVGVAFGQGSLTPPGAPAPTMKTLDELDSSIVGVSNAVSTIQDEARTPISSAGYTISSPGSYYLTADLMPAGGGFGIRINVSDVTLDLNGFSIFGGLSTGSGISMNDRDNVVIKNGTIRDCYYFGIAAFRSSRCQFENLRVLNNGQSSSSYNGIHAGTNSTITGCIVMDNGSGVEADAESSVVGNQIINNTSDGLKITGSGSYIADNIVKGNGDNYDLAAGNQLNILLCEIPESLDWPCSVKLAGTLTCMSNGVSGITVNSDDVSIDLDGHTLVGPGTSSGHGIYQSSTYRNLRVFNGKATGWQGTDKAGIAAYGSGFILSDMQVSIDYGGVDALYGGSISDCVACDNITFGIYAGAKSRIADCTAVNNGGDGIYAGNGSTISGCAANNNGDDGIVSGGNCTIYGCAATDNVGEGINASFANKISDCVARQNEKDGINAANGSSVSDCVARQNADDGIYVGESSTVSACTTSYNTGDGIEVYMDSYVVNCTSDNNGYTGDGAGIHATNSDNRIDGNTVTDNDRGIDVDKSGNFIVRNTASGNTGDWAIASGNNTGTIQTTPVGAGPWDNFEF